MPGTKEDMAHGIVLLFVKLQKIYSLKGVSEMFIITCGQRYKYTEANLFAEAENDEYFGMGVCRLGHTAPTQCKGLFRKPNSAQKALC